MKKLFIYYSLTYNGDMIASFLKERGFEVRKVLTKKEYPTNKFLMIMTGGYKAIFNKKEELFAFDNDISEYDKIVIGSPIWADRLSAPINTVLTLLNLNNKDVTFVLYSASGNANKASEKLKQLYNKPIIILKEPKSNEKELEKLMYL